MKSLIVLLFVLSLFSPLGMTSEVDYELIPPLKEKPKVEKEDLHSLIRNLDGKVEFLNQDNRDEHRELRKKLSYIDLKINLLFIFILVGIFLLLLRNKRKR